jgi:hypothetical protein
MAMICNYPVYPIVVAGGKTEDFELNCKKLSLLANMNIRLSF